MTSSLPEPANVNDVTVDRLLKLVVDELGVETAFIGRIDEERRTICYVTGGGAVSVGDSDPRDETYCQLLVDGRIPQVIPDVNEVPLLRDLAVTDLLNIGSYVGLPLTLSDGTLYGTLCAFGSRSDPSLVNSDARVLRLVAALLADRLEDDVVRERAHREMSGRIADAVARDDPQVVFQPIFDIKTRNIVGFEALSRFSAEPYRPPNEWFGDAAAVGSGVELELAAITNALRAATALPARCYVTVNASAATVVSGRLAEVLAAAGDRPIVVELTEHDEAVLGELAGPLADLKALGYRLALDDLGAGHSGLTRLLAIRPNIIKLDRDIVSGVDGDVVRRSLIAAATMFAPGAGGTIVAEGVETAAEAETLAKLGVPYVQGYHFGRPAPAATWASAAG